MWQKNEYIFGYPHGEAPFEAQYREEYEAFERFMQLTLGEQWIIMKQMRIAICQTVDSIIK
mgnify:CR=1 FL=1